MGEWVTISLITQTRNSLFVCPGLAVQGSARFSLSVREIGSVRDRRISDQRGHGGDWSPRGQVDEAAGEMK